MKIVVAHNYYQQPGGEDQCVAAEVAMLSTHGHKVITYCLHNNAIDAMNGIEVASRTIWSQPAFREMRELFRTHRPQIVHFHNTFPLISPAAYYAAQAEKVRVVQTLHNFRLLCPGGALFRSGYVCEDCLGKPIPWRSVTHKCYRGSRAASAAVAAMLTVHRALGTWRNEVDVYIALTEFARRKLVEGGLPGDKIAVKSNFAEPDPGPGSGRGGYGVFVGRLSPEKGVETLLAAWRHLDGSLPLKIVGDGPMASLVWKAATENSRIQWLGNMPLETVYALIGEAAFLVAPSECYETFSRVTMEAFAKGTPVIAARPGAMAELVEDAQTGLCFTRGDPAGLATKVRQIMAQPLELARMRRAARQKFERDFTGRSNHKRLMEIYEQALSGRPNGETLLNRI